MDAQRNPQVDAYLETFPPATQQLLAQLRELILKTVPGVEETIGYQMPAYRLDGALVYFAGYKHHIGFYPTGSGIEAFKKELSVFKGAKGSVQFPLDKPLPLTLIARIVRFRVKENQAKAKEKLLKKTTARAKRSTTGTKPTPGR